MFRKIIEKKNTRTGEYVFKEDNRASLETIKEHIEASLKIGDYIKTGIDLHQEGYYIFELDREMERLQKEYKDEDGNWIRYNERLDTLEKALKNPCIHAGMLSDTVCIMQSDVGDMLQAKNPFDENRTIISLEDELTIAKTLEFTKDDINNMARQLLSLNTKVNVENLSVEDSLKEILASVKNVRIPEIQNLMATNIGGQGFNNKVRFESVSDEYKMFADNYKSKYEEYIGKKLTKEEWDTRREKGLQEQRNLLKENNPLLCLTYEIQNQLMYGKILNRDNIKVLNNDLDRNRAVFSRTYDYLYRIGNTKITELTKPEEITIKNEMNIVYKSKDYPKHFDEVGRDGRISKNEIVKNLVIYKIQQMGNNDLKEFYNEHIKEDEILKQIEVLENQGLSENEIVEKLDGINQVAYEGMKKQDENMRQKIETLRETKSNEEIAINLKLEKRNFDEIINEESTLKRYIKYRMTLSEIEEITNQSKELEYGQDNEFNIDMEDLINTIPIYDETAEMHDQKSEQFFEDKESGKYNVPETALVEYNPNSLKSFFSNIINKIKSLNVFGKKNEDRQGEQIENTASDKLQIMKEKFEESLVVSKEEQEKNRKEYEQSKQKSARLSVTKEKEQEGDERD